MDKVVHFEVPADDLDRAQKFYSDVFGWKIDKVPGQDIEYRMAYTVPVDEKFMPKETGAINGGMVKRSNKESVVIVINVSSVDEYAKKVEDARGKVVMPAQKVMNMGLYARVEDTEGNVIGIWQDLR